MHVKELSKEDITTAATKYAEEENNCYSNDLYGFENGARWAQEHYHPILAENERLKNGLIAIKNEMKPRPGRRLKHTVHNLVNKTLYPDTFVEKK